MMRSKPPRFVLATAIILVLMGLDMALPQGIRISIFYSLPMYWLAWQGERRAAWLIGLLTPLVFMWGVRPLAGRPPVTWLQEVNWLLQSAEDLLCIELIWRGRWYVDRLGEALGRERRRTRQAEGGEGRSDSCRSA
jgi:hypothetical protein